jgi:hypothetical protein
MPGRLLRRLDAFAAMRREATLGAGFGCKRMIPGKGSLHRVYRQSALTTFLRRKLGIRRETALFIGNATASHAGDLSALFRVHRRKTKFPFDRMFHDANSLIAKKLGIATLCAEE